MINIIKEEVSIDEALKRKLEFICEFNHTSAIFINDSIRKVDKSNLSYIGPHKIIINNSTFFAFNYYNELYIKSFGNKILISEGKKVLNEKDD